jgi:hypothetical protein
MPSAIKGETDVIQHDPFIWTISGIGSYAASALSDNNPTLKGEER